MGSNTRTTRGGGNEGSGSRLEEAYFRWLVEQVREEGAHPEHTYWDVLRIMHETEFLWQVPNDDNRIVDGREVKAEFLLPRGVEFEPGEPGGAASCLEVMIGISRRLAWVAGESAEGWAWQLLCNLGLHRMPDPLSRAKAARVEDILSVLIWRNYDPDGSGGFFPLAWPKGDQRQTEIWYQMQAYAMEIHPEY